MANTIVLTAVVAKENLLDSRIDGNDIVYGMTGSILASLLFSLYPEKTFEVEVEGGMSSFSPGTNYQTPPPASTMYKGQTTIWWKGILGLHLFLGGNDTGAADDSGKRLVYGAGLRTSLFPFPYTKKKRSIFSSWIGADFGRIMFATSAQNVEYTKSKETMFYTMGGRLHLTRSFMGTTEVQFIPYDDEQVWAWSVALGITF